MRGVVGLVLLLGLMACGGSRPVTTLDLCGTAMSTEAVLTTAFNKGRTDAVADWLVENLAVPGRVTECLPNQAPRTIDLTWFRLYRIGTDGQPSSTVHEWGNLPAGDTNLLHSQLNIFADPLASNEAFGYELYGTEIDEAQ